MPVVLNPSQQTAIESFIMAARLDQRYVASIEDQQAGTDAIVADLLKRRGQLTTRVTELIETLSEGGRQLPE